MFGFLPEKESLLTIMIAFIASHKKYDITLHL